MRYIFLTMLLFCSACSAKSEKSRESCCVGNGSRTRSDLIDKLDQGPIDPWVMRDLIGRGINLKAVYLHNAPGWGVEYDSAYVDAIKQAGFDSVRIWAVLQSEAGTRKNYADDVNNTIHPGFFKELDERINDVLDREMVVVLNFLELGGFDSATEEWKVVLVNLWRQIAEHYKDYSHRLVFQPINESHDELDAVLSDWYAAVTDEIRKTNPTRILLYSPANWGKGDLSEIMIPASAGEYYMGGVHPYEPHCYTHQGWGKCGTNLYWDAANPDDLSPIDELLDKQLAWSKEHNKPVIADEWGTGNVPCGEEQLAWATYVRDACLKRGFAYMYFDFIDAHDWGIYDTAKKEWKSETLKDVLVGGEAPWDNKGCCKK
jgi:endoglucanase